MTQKTALLLFLLIGSLEITVKKVVLLDLEDCLDKLTLSSEWNLCSGLTLIL